MTSPLAILGEVVQKVFAHCQVGQCRFYSLGVVCGRCSRRVCLKHGYVTLSAPPLAICAACAISDHPDLLREAKLEKGQVAFKLLKPRRNVA